jgi:acyl carrier protein
VNELDEKLQSLLVGRSAAILKCKESEIQWQDDLDEFGFDSLGVSQLCVELNQLFSIDIHPALFLEVTSLEALSGYLKKKYYPALERTLLE